MPKFCIHESHTGVCEKTGSYCNEGVCPYEDMRDFAEVVHGRWIRPHWKNNNYCCNCSECGGEAMHTDYQWDKNGIYPLCPNCGAKMAREETNELD